MGNTTGIFRLETHGPEDVGLESMALDPAGPKSALPEQSIRSGNLSVGMWDSTAFESEMRAFSVCEFAQILEGEVTITGAYCTGGRFVAGEALFIPMGTVCSWKSDGYLKKQYATAAVR